MIVAVGDPRTERIVFIDSQDIRYISVNGRRVMLNTKEGEYYVLAGLEEIGAWLELVDPGVRKVDRTGFINMDQIHTVNEKLLIAYFTDPAEGHADKFYINERFYEEFQQYVSSRSGISAAEMMKILLLNEHIYLSGKAMELHSSITKALDALGVTYDVERQEQEITIRLIK